MKAFFIIPLLLVALLAQAKPIELVFWHSMAGHLGDEVNAIVDAFNQSQNEYIIKSVYKGNYLETLTSFAAAFRAHQAPAMVQIFEVGTGMMLTPKGIIKPVDELMVEQGLSLPKNDFIPSVRQFYSREGALMAMPFNLSTPILYYNRPVLQRMGYDERNFPKTWAEMEILAEQIKKLGYDCVYTTAYPGWILFESYLAIHGLPLTQGEPVRAVFNVPQFAGHLQRLKRWHERGYFRYGGRVDDATILFTSGVCPLFSQSSGAYNSLSAIAPFTLGLAMMPLDTEVSPIRHANVAGGAALWAVAGQTDREYRGLALFFAFLARPSVQQQWHEHTGYFPLGFNGIYQAIIQTSAHPTLSVAHNDLTEQGSSPAIQYTGPQYQIRNVSDEMLESMFAGLTSTQEALKHAIQRSNHLLWRFYQNVSSKQPVNTGKEGKPKYF